MLDSGAACSVVGLNFLEKIVPDWEEKISAVNNMRFRGCSEPLEALGVIEMPIIFAHSQGSVRIKPEFVVMKNVTPHYFVLGGDFLSVYGIDIIHSREKYFQIGNENKKKKMAFSRFRSTRNLGEPRKGISNARKTLSKETLERVKRGPNLDSSQKDEILQLIENFPDSFGLGEVPIGTIKGHEIEINLLKPYSPILRKAAYPASPRNRMELQKHIQEWLKLKVIRKVSENEEV